MKRLLWLVFVMTLPLSATFSQVISDFEGGTTDGWVSEGDGVYTWESGTGNPGGCFRVDDDATGDMNYSYAPMKFLGNWSAATANDTLRADIYLNQVATAYVTSNFVFRIQGPGGQATAILNPKPPFKTWKQYKVSLSAADWQLNSGTWAGLLQNVTTLIITMEYISGDEFNRLDNVTLSFTPVPMPVVPVVCSGFEEAGYDGWIFTGTGGVSNVTSGGNPGRYIQVGNGSGTAYGYAPNKFLGDWNQLDNHAAEIRFDLRITSTSGSLVLNDAFLRIAGPDGAAKIPLDSSILEAYGAWKTFTYAVDDAAWTMESGTWDLLMNSVTSLRICLEFTSSTETVGLDNFCITNLPPNSEFTADSTLAYVGTTVHFTDLTTLTPSSWLWDFGDGTTSTFQNPSHLYTQPGIYTVSLTTSNYYGNDTETKSGFIRILPVNECEKFADTFSLPSIGSLWTLHNGTWDISSGTLRQSSNYYGTSSVLDGCYAITGFSGMADYTIAADLKTNDNDLMGLVFNFQDYQNMYLFTWNLQTPQRILYRWVNGVSTVLASDNTGYTTNTWHRVELGGYNGNITLTVNGSLIFDVWDTTFTSGRAGLYNYANQSTYYDNVLISCVIPDTLDIAGDTINSGQSSCFEALKVLIVGGSEENFIVQSGGQANLVAGQKIRMLPGVRALSGSYMHAYISSDGYYCKTPPPGGFSPEKGLLTSTPFNENDHRRNLTIYPNPSEGDFTVRLSGIHKYQLIDVEVFSLPGTLVAKRTGLSGDDAPVRLSNAEPGLYLVKVRAGDELYFGKIIIRKR